MNPPRALRTWQGCTDRISCSAVSHRFIPNIGWQHIILTGCPDGATCHHRCLDACFRVDSCGPLSGVYPEDRWPEIIHQVYGSPA
jgi:hypothetical protein